MVVSPPFLPASSSPSKPTKSTATPSPGFMQNSNALQQELSDQLAQMATQLKRNAIHFSDSLGKDQAVVEDAQLKIEGNYDVMKKERLRARDLRGKSGSTTCLVVMSVVAVLVAFVIMVLVIRAT
jgi:SNARE protein 1